MNGINDFNAKYFLIMLNILDVKLKDLFILNDLSGVLFSIVCFPHIFRHLFY